MLMDRNFLLLLEARIRRLGAERKISMGGRLLVEEQITCNTPVPWVRLVCLSGLRESRVKIIGIQRKHEVREVYQKVEGRMEKSNLSSLQFCPQPLWQQLPHLQSLNKRFTLLNCFGTFGYTKSISTWNV